MVELDSQALTHVAAIAVGVLVTLVLVGGFSSNSKTTDAPPTSTSNGDASTGLSKNQKKKKKKKAKGGASAETEKSKEHTSNGAKANGTKAVAKAAVTPKETPKEEDSEDEEPAPKPVEKPTNGKKKKKKNKKPANGNAKAATNGTANGDNGKKENEPKAANTAPVIPPEEPAWQPPPVVEEEWNDVPVSKKKKRPKASKPAAAAPAPAPVAAPTSTDMVAVDAKKIGIIIGPKGATMIALQEATGCTLDINAPDKDAKPATAAKATVAIAGPDKESCTKAKQAIQELATKGYARLLQADGFGEFSIQVHPRVLSEIVGPGGKCIQALQKTLDVKITIPSTDWKPGKVQVGKAKICNVGIAGSKENSKLCKEAIKQIMEYHHSEITHPGMIHEEVYVPQEFFHCVIGPRGSEIKHIKGNYKVDMYMPNADSKSENVVVVGKRGNVDKAISYIQLLMDRDSEQRAQKYSDEYYGEEEGY